MTKIVELNPNVLIRPLSDDITVRIILTHNVSILIQTLDFCAPDAGGGPPHHLRVVRAIPVRHARIRSVIVVRLLRRKRRHRLGGRPLAPLPPEYVLAVVESGVFQGAVRPPLVRPPLGVVNHLCAPTERREVVACPHRVVGFKEFRDHDRRVRFGGPAGDDGGFGWVDEEGEEKGGEEEGVEEIGGVGHCGCLLRLRLLRWVFIAAFMHGVKVFSIVPVQVRS